MSITLDFILLFLLIIIPGLIFKLFYFWNEFSKQFKTKGTAYKSLFYSIIPGIIIQALGLWFYLKKNTNSLDTVSIIDVFHDILNEKSIDYKEITSTFLEAGLLEFIKHELWVYFLAAGLGYILYLIVRNFKLDCRIKLLRFNNIWYYIFSGEIQRFQKFQKARQRVPIIGNIRGKSTSYYPPYIDVLVDTNSGNQMLYTGFVIDYDLNHENTNELDKIYLSNASRYRDIREGEKVLEENRFGNKVKVPIKGDYMILQANQILNMNIQYEYYESQFTKWNRKERWMRRLYNFGAFLYILIFTYFIFLPTLFEKLIPTFTEHLEGYNFFSRVFSAFIVAITLSLLFPSKQDIEEDNQDNEEDEDKAELDKKRTSVIYKYDRREIFAKIVNVILLCLIYLYIYY